MTKIIELNNKSMINNNNDKKDYWNILPPDLKVYIMNFNKEAEKREMKTNIYPWLDGKVKIYKSPKIKNYYWINCVSCGVDTSMRKSNRYHWCSKCYRKYGHRFWEETTEQYNQRMQELIDSGDTTPLKTSRPLLLGKDNCPFVNIDGKLVQQPIGEYKFKFMLDNKDFFED
jgi:hypothetical protein